MIDRRSVMHAVGISSNGGSAMAAPGRSGVAGNGRPRLRVVVAEASYLVREALAVMLGGASEVELLAVCADGNELRGAIAGGCPDVVITDIRMPPSGADEGVRIATSLRETNPQTGVVVLSQYAQPAPALAVLGQGTAGRAYLLTERIADKDELIDAILKVARGGSVIDPLIVDVLIQARGRRAQSRLAQLTTREREVLAEIASGKSNAGIAEALVLTKRAVEKHVHAIFSRLDLPEDPDVSRRVKATLIFLSEDEDAAARLHNRSSGSRFAPRSG